MKTSDKAKRADGRYPRVKKYAKKFKAKIIDTEPCTQTLERISWQVGYCWDTPSFPGLRDNIWRWWRNAPGFSQRFTGTIVDGGRTIIGKAELSKDGSSWEKDLELTYKRVK